MLAARASSLLACRTVTVFRTSPILGLALVLAGVVGCKKHTSGHRAAKSSAPVASAAAPPASHAAASASAAPPAARAEPDPKLYTWLADKSLDEPKAVDTLESHFKTPPGYQRVAEPPGSFGAWLRTLPLAAPGTPVKSYKGDVIYPADEKYLAAVVAIDVGKADLQQSPDVVVRLDAEWRFSKGERDMSYEGATGLDMPLARYAKGERIVALGGNVFWAPRAKPVKIDYPAFRNYLDIVFTWANSTSLSKQGTKVEPADIRPGDFFVHQGKPGHVVLVLDIAQKPSGQKLALLGQALNPAENIHVLRPGVGTAWFSLHTDLPLLTPHTAEFPWNGLRRLVVAPTQTGKD